MLRTIVQAANYAHIPTDCLPSIHISGCMSSCGAHQASVIGLQGCIKRVNGTGQPAFSLTFLGCSRLGKEALGQALGAITIKQIPFFFIELGNTVDKSGQSFDQWIKKNEETFCNLALKYINMEA